MIKLDVFMIWVFMPIFVGCATYKIENNTPTFLDTNKGYGRVYTAEKIEPKECGAPDYLFKYSGTTKPITEMNGWVCIPPDQVQYNLNYYNNYIKQKANCK